MKVGIVTFEKFHGRKTNSIGSSRIRAYNLVKYWEEASIYKHAKKYDVLIFQKAYWIEMAKKFEGIKILDLCDPDFLDWHYNIKRWRIIVMQLPVLRKHWLMMLSDLLIVRYG